MKKGDWIEQRDTPNTRGIIKSISNARHTPKATLLLSGCSGVTILDLKVLEDGWEPMEWFGSEVPYWVRKGNAFRPAVPLALGHAQKCAQATIYDVQHEWVAYNEHFAGKTEHPRFMMLRWWEFRKSWEPVTPPDAWERVLNLED